METIPLFTDDAVKDCPTCAHTRGALCLSPQYLQMNESDKKQFWSAENLEPPCALWQPEQSALAQGN